MNVSGSNNAESTLKTLSYEFEKFVDVCGELPNYLLLSTVFYGYLCYIVNKKLGKPLHAPIDEHRGCTISIMPGIENPYFEFVRFENIS